MKKYSFKLLLIIVLSVLFLPNLVRAQAESNVSASISPVQELPDTYYRAKVVKILEEGKEDVDGQTQDHQKLELQILSGDKVGQQINIDHGGSFAITAFQKVTEGETVIVAHPPQTPGAIQNVYYIVDKYRLPVLGWEVAIFFLLAIYFGRRRGFTAIFGLLFSVLVIFYYVIPKILNG